MRALEHLYTQQERWYETLDIYDMMNAVLSEPQRRVEVLNRQGTLQVQQLQDIGGAIDTYRRVLGIQPESADAVEALEVLYRREERWEELADVYELHLNAVEDTQYRIAIVVSLVSCIRFIWATTSARSRVYCQFWMMSLCTSLRCRRWLSCIKSLNLGMIALVC